jgi:hypothetical protein
MTSLEISPWLRSSTIAWRCADRAHDPLVLARAVLVVGAVAVVLLAGA